VNAYAVTLTAGDAKVWTRTIAVDTVHAITEAARTHGVKVENITRVEVELREENAL
jgi:hypothetical protein